MWEVRTAKNPKKERKGKMRWRLWATLRVHKKGGGRGGVLVAKKRNREKWKGT